MSENEFGDFDLDGMEEAELIQAAEAAEARALAGALFTDEVEDEVIDQTPAAALSSGSRGNSSFRQQTLFGTRMVESEAHSSPSIARSRPLGTGKPPRPPPPPQRPEKPTHHQLDLDAAKRWIYPLNMTVRDYQFNIVQKALFHNVLCALPTGLGKTLIASVVMRNWYDWAPKSKVIFMAPTKPLISQQLDACYKICGIPKSQTALMTGHTSVANRAEAYRTKRMFFCTPQTVENDIRNGYLDVKDIVCIVVDEAHRATGNYAYANVVRLLEGRGGMSRILALTATPGSTVEAVQQVIDNLHVSRIEIRSEDSLDIRQYVFKKTIDKVVVPLSDEIIELRDLYAKVLDVFLKKLNGANAFGLRDATALVPFSVMKAKEAWMRTPAAQQNAGMRNAYMSIFTLLASLAHPMMLLQQHGIRPFYTHLNEIQNETEGRGKKAGKLKSELIGNEDFRTLMRRVREMIGEPTYIGHPKMDRMSGLLLEHFMRAKDEGRQTRCIVFTNYRESADDILQTLAKHKPLVLPTMFHGQASAKDQAGMTQKEQIEIVDKFLKGDFNTLVATSIGEEGLDIGDVDLIVCYDSSSSPIRMLQRQGRTGRKREGRAVVLVTEGKEDSNYGKALDNYKTMQRKIEQGSDFILQDEKSFRMLPRDVQPVCEKVMFEAPEEPEEPKTKGKKGREPKLKRPPKKFYMPDGVELGFQTVSVGRKGAKDAHEEVEDDTPAGWVPQPEPEPYEPDPEESPYLNEMENKILSRRFKSMRGTPFTMFEAPHITDPLLMEEHGRYGRFRWGKRTKGVWKMLQGVDVEDLREGLDLNEVRAEREAAMAARPTVARAVEVKRGMTERNMNVRSPTPPELEAESKASQIDLTVASQEIRKAVEVSKKRRLVKIVKSEAEEESDDELPDMASALKGKNKKQKLFFSDSE